MRFHIITIFPGYFDSPLSVGVLSRALKDGIISVETADLRNYSTDAHRRVDDYSFGGGAGMVMKPEPAVKAIKEARAANPDARVYAMSPGGQLLTDDLARQLATDKGLILLCGRYEGIDQRVIDHYCDGELSVGNYVLSGGEAAALCVVDAVARQIPGVVGKEENIATDSFSAGLKHPVYTRPEDFEGRTAPATLLSGDQKRIDAWRRREALMRTKKCRPEQILEAGRHKVMLEFDNTPALVPIAFSKTILQYGIAGAVLISGDADQRKSFRECRPGKTLSAPTKKEADRKIEKIIGDFDRLPIDAKNLETSETSHRQLIKLLRKDRGAVLTINAIAGRDKVDAIIRLSILLTTVLDIKGSKTS